MRLIQKSCTHVTFGIAAACMTLVGLPSAHAGFVAAPLHFNIEVSDGGGVVYSDSYEADTKFELGGGQFAYDILSISHSAFNFTPSTFTIASGQPTTTLPAGIFTGFNFQNLTGENLQVVVSFVLETSFTSANGLLPWSSSVSAGVSGNTAVSTVPGSPLWQASIDGNALANLFADPSSLSGSEGAGTSDTNANGFTPPPSSNMTIQVVFDITPGGQVTFNGNFIVTPGPGSLALLAIGGLVGVRRRRRS